MAENSPPLKARLLRFLQRHNETFFRLGFIALTLPMLAFIIIGMLASTGASVYPNPSPANGKTYFVHACSRGGCYDGYVSPGLGWAYNATNPLFPWFLGLLFLFLFIYGRIRDSIPAEGKDLRNWKEPEP